MARKKKRVSRPQSEDSNEELYQVEVITKARVNDERNWEYFVKWAGYDSDVNSWEPQEHMEGCERLLQSFWLDVGEDDNDYPIGYQVSATPAWIKREKATFLKGLNQSESKQDSDDSDEPIIQTKGKGKAVSQPHASKESDAEDSDSATEVSLAFKRMEQKRLSKKPKRTKTSNQESDSSSSVVPLRLSIIVPPRPSTTASGRGEGPSRILSQPTLKRANKPAPASTPRINLATIPNTMNNPEASERTKPRTVSHTERQANPLIKQIDLPASSIAAGSTLSTKQRIAQGLKPMYPKPAIPSLAKRTNNLAGLGFKKKPPPPPAPPAPHLSSSTEINDAMLPSTSELFPPNTGNDPIFYNDNPPIDDQLGFNQDDLPDHGMDYSAPPEVPLIPTQSNNASSQNAPSATDRFLASIMPAMQVLSSDAHQYECNSHPFMSISFGSSMSDDGASIPRVPPKTDSSILTQKIPKKWKWNGDLFVNTSPEKAQRFCEVTIGDATDSQPGQARFSTVFASLDSLRLYKFYDVGDTRIILGACDSVHQYAKLRPATEAADNEVKALLHYMTVRQKIAVIPMSLDDAEVAIIIIFPSALQDCCQVLHVPSEFHTPNNILVALLPWSLTSTKYSNQEILSDLGELIQDTCSVSISAEELERRARGPIVDIKSWMRQALRLLAFPQHLKESLASRKYCIWSTCGYTSPVIDYEVKLLKTILGNYKANDVGLEGGPRLVFVHVGALQTIQHLPALANKRGNHPEMKFYTFGSHETVPKHRWGVREIFPIGGIVTFTSSALIENPFGCYQLMSQITQHPLWDCYLIPSVIGLAAKLIADTKPLSTSLASEAFQPFFSLIEQGRMSLLWSPPHFTDTARDTNAWVVWQVKCLTLKADALLQECLTASTEQYAGIPPAALRATMEQDVSDDMTNMQIHPSIAEKYCRFVIIKATTDSHIPWDRDGFEWCALADFDFKDNFFVSKASHRSKAAS